MKDFLEYEIERQLDILADENAAALTAVAAECPKIAAHYAGAAADVVEYIEKLTEEYFKADD